MKLLGSLMGNNATGGNMLGSLLGKAMGGGGNAEAGAAGGATGGIGSMLGGLLGGGGGATGGGAGALLGSVLGGGAAAGGIGSMLGGLLGGGGGAEAAPEAAAPAAADQATLMIRAMCNAAKADGEVDAQEQQNIIGKLGDDVGEAEINFLKQELAAPLDLAGFASSVPAQMAPQIYAVSVMTVKVDTPQEAQYLQQLGQALNLDAQALGSIHQQLGLS